MVQIDPVNEINTMSNTNNTIKIASRYSNLTEAVAMRSPATIKRMSNDQRPKVVQVFSDDRNNIFYVLRVIRKANLEVVI